MNSRMRCFQYVKFIKFESNSQLKTDDYGNSRSCFQYVKFIKFESNSQLSSIYAFFTPSCFQYVKFIKFESNSQQGRSRDRTESVVFSMSNL